MVAQVPDLEALPLYGCVTGIELPVESFSVSEGVSLRKGIFEVFASPMLAFKEASAGSFTPGPLVPIRGGFHFKARVELVLEDLSKFEGFSPSKVAWLIAALIRLRANSPVRITTVANQPLASLPDNKEFWALAFESSPHQIGLFRDSIHQLKQEDLVWLSESLSVATQFLHEERFLRAFGIFDESLWSGRTEMVTALIWTAIEILFGLSSEYRGKTKAICSALSDFVAVDDQDRNRAYNVVRDLYEKRGRIVHAGRQIDEQDFIQTFWLAKTVFSTVLDNAELPPKRNTLH